MQLLNLGMVPYDEALTMQHRFVAARKSDKVGAPHVDTRADDVLILLEHPPVITLGRQADESNIIAVPDLLDELGITVRRVERGGDVTYHGPGQLMGYPILDLRQHRKDVGWYVDSLKAVLVRTLAQFGIDAVPGDGNETGVWVGDDKIAAIGARIEDWVTFHGFALYVDPVMAHFDLIVPCGLQEKGITSMRQVLAEPLGLAEVRHVVARQFEKVFDVELCPTTHSSPSR